MRRLPESRMVDIRGNRVSMIFQQPQSSLNPVFRVGDQLSEVLQIHQDVGKDVGEKRAIELLAMVGVPDPESRARFNSIASSPRCRERNRVWRQ